MHLKIIFECNLSYHKYWKNCTKQFFVKFFDNNKTKLHIKMYKHFSVNFFTHIEISNRLFIQLINFQYLFMSQEKGIVNAIFCKLIYMSSGNIVILGCIFKLSSK